MDKDLGTAVLVGGCLVSWFIDPKQFVEWTRENYFGQWVTWRAEVPLIVQLTAEEQAGVDERTAEIVAKLRIE